MDVSVTVTQNVVRDSHGQTMIVKKLKRFGKCAFGDEKYGVQFFRHSRFSVVN